MTKQRLPLRGTAVLVLVAGAVLATVAGHAQQRPRFYSDDPLWQEPIVDVPKVERYESTLFYDTMENVFGKPGDPNLDTRARNVNTVDEVMDGPWFTNRAGLRPLSVQEVAKGANASRGPAAGRWTIVSSKSDGVTPGFTIRDANDDTWFLKFDPPGYRAMSTGTEVAASRLFWALGYHTVEYHIARLRLDDLVIGDSATITPPGAGERRMHKGDLHWLLQRAQAEPDGTYRVIASKAAPGRPVGRIVFHGTRSDDPNDLVPHEHHRELRGYRVFAAWLNHVDAKSINSLDVLVKDNGKQFIRHYLLDFSSTMGAGSTQPREYFEGYEPVIEPYGEIGKRMIALGFRVPKWRTLEFYEAPSIGRIPASHADWDPEAWTPRFPNSVFRHAREDDKFWAARKLQGLTDDMIAAAVAEGQFGDETAEAALVRFLKERKAAILKRYLPAVNPVVDPAIDARGNLTFANAAVDAGTAPAPGEYLVTWARFDNLSGEAKELAQTKGGLQQPSPEGLPSDRGAYVRVAIAGGAGSPAAWTQPLHAYFRRGSDGWQLVGLERMQNRP